MLSPPCIRLLTEYIAGVHGPTLLDIKRPVRRTLQWQMERRCARVEIFIQGRSVKHKTFMGKVTVDACVADDVPPNLLMGIDNICYVWYVRRELCCIRE